MLTRISFSISLQESLLYILNGGLHVATTIPYKTDRQIIFCVNKVYKVHVEPILYLPLFQFISRHIIYIYISLLVQNVYKYSVENENKIDAF